MLVVTLMSFFLAGIIFMVGMLLGSARIRNFGAAEFYEAVATAIIVVAFVYICAVLFGLGPGALVANINPYATAFHLMGGTITTAQAMYTSIYNVYFPISQGLPPGQHQRIRIEPRQGQLLHRLPCGVGHRHLLLNI